MTSIFEITDWAHVASFFVWTLAVCALAKAIFGSFPAAELQYRLALRDNPRRQRLNRLNWEVANRTRWDEDVARGSPHAAPVRLTDDEVEARRGELQNLNHTSLPWRALQYLLNCWACQTFWVAVAIFGITRGVDDMTAWLFSATSYSGAAVLVATFRGGGYQALSSESSRKPTCSSCGR
ncbi:MAG: hypothetical protein LC121_21800 [Anaerolineae bacterium]|nr:hypothetical protein [Anaerolineae bacterium]